MPRRQRGALTTRARGRGRGQMQYHHHIPPMASTGPSPIAEFTLADEARRTLRDNHSSWENANLRRVPIEFVSAGSSQKGEKQQNVTVGRTVISTRPEQEATELRADEDIGLAQEHSEASSPTSGSTRQRIIARKGVDIEPRSLSDVQKRDRDCTSHGVPTESDRRLSLDNSSGSEELLFQGRNRAQKSVRHRSISLTTMHTELRAVEEQLPKYCKTYRQHPVTDGFLGLGKSHHRHRHQRGHDDASRREEDAVFADYIENLRQNGEFINDANPDLPTAHIFESMDSEIQSTGGTAEEAIQTLGSTTNDETQGSSASENGSDSDAPLRTSPDNLDPEDQHDIPEPETDGGHPDQDEDEPDDQFDFMDWERPSLRQRNVKWPLIAMYVQGSDPELEQKLQTAWKKDRLKKSERRQLREELRMAGMLGKKAETADLRATYPTGMTLQQIAGELKAFLLRTDEVLLLPPMDTHARKSIHELASKFNLKSKSTGKGDQRRTSLHRKKGSLRFEQVSFDSAFKRIHRKYFPRSDVDKKSSRQIVSSQANHSAVKVRDGEIVGGAAPELGAENRGRAMLEKMGWSTGTALGADDNKGILQPVTHTMKRSKAGLG